MSILLSLNTVMTENDWRTAVLSCPRKKDKDADDTGRLVPVNK